MKTFQSVINDIEEHVQSAEWKTDAGHILHGVLFQRNNRVTLNVNAKALAETINVEYIYREDVMGNRRTLYPYDIWSCRHISPTESEAWPIEVYMIVDEYAAKIPGIENAISFTYDSFVWDHVPEKTSEDNRFHKLFSKIQDMDTSLGKVSVSMGMSENRSMHPSSFEKRMDKIVITVKPTESLSNQDLLMWNARFTQLLTLLHKERVVTRSIARGLSDITVPELIEHYEEAHYAFRKMIDTHDFVEVIKRTLPTFVDNYDAIATFIEELARYYYDYPLNPPDSIQLLRLFTSLEQCANYAQKTEKILSKQLAAEQVERQKEFNKLLDLIKQDKTTIPDPVRIYLRDTAQKFYVSSGSLSTPKHKITALAQLLSKIYKVYNCLSDLSNVEAILKMRNIVAHGSYNPKVSDIFYANRDRYGQAIEECIRMYIFRALGCTPTIVLKHKDPLKARQFYFQ